MIGAFWGALAALGIGVSDLFGRRIVATVGPLTAALTMQAVAVLTSLATVLVFGGLWDLVDLSWGGLSGVGMAVGLGCYFGGLNASSATVVSPVVATLSAVIPYGYALARGSEASPTAIAGAAVSFAGLGLVATGSDDVRRLGAGMAWALVSGLGYGFATSVLIEVDAASGAWPAVSQRAVALVALGSVAYVARRPLVPPLGLRLRGLGAGAATGFSSIFVLLGVAADAPPAVVATSMFPLATVTVGALAYGDPVTRRQMVGIVIALAGIIAVVTG